MEDSEDEWEVVGDDGEYILECERVDDDDYVAEPLDLERYDHWSINRFWLAAMLSEYFFSEFLEVPANC